jgi:hypothetical protein
MYKLAQADQQRKRTRDNYRNEAASYALGADYMLLTARQQSENQATGKGRLMKFWMFLKCDLMIGLAMAVVTTMLLVDVQRITPIGGKWHQITRGRDGTPMQLFTLNGHFAHDLRTTESSVYDGRRLYLLEDSKDWEWIAPGGTDEFRVVVRPKFLPGGTYPAWLIIGRGADN